MDDTKNLEEPPQGFLKNLYRYFKKYFFKNKNGKESLQDEIFSFIDENQNEIFSENNIGNSSDLSKSSILEVMKDLILFYKIVLDEVKIPRNKIISISEEEIFKIFDLFAQNKISNIIIFSENLDHIAGFINIKDLFNFTIQNPDSLKNPGDSMDQLKSLIKKPLFSPPTMKASNLLSIMKKEQIYISIIVDEHGGTDGMVTINDLISEISREFDEEMSFFLQNKDDNSFEINPLIPLDFLEEKIGPIDRLDFDNIETLNGFLISVENRIPEINFEINLNDDFFCKILEIDERLIKKVLIKKR
jgi:CBS domain containing-hemolysin-like protein